MNAQLQKEKEAEVQARQAARSVEQASGGGGTVGKGWGEEDLQLLIKAVNLFPAGTNARSTTAPCFAVVDVKRRVRLSFLSTPLCSRWEVIANYMNLHSNSGMKRTAKDVINKAKNLQRLGEISNVASSRGREPHDWNTD